MFWDRAGVILLAQSRISFKVIRRSLQMSSSRHTLLLGVAAVSSEARFVINISVFVLKLADPSACCPCIDLVCPLTFPRCRSVSVNKPIAFFTQEFNYAHLPLTSFHDKDCLSRCYALNIWNREIKLSVHVRKRFSHNKVPLSTRPIHLAQS